LNPRMFRRAATQLESADVQTSDRPT
jgi:hypothetical protein